MENDSNPNENSIPKTSRPPLSLWFFCVGILLLIFVLKFVSCTVFSQIDVMDEMKKAQNPPQLKIVP